MAAGDDSGSSKEPHQMTAAEIDAEIKRTDRGDFAGCVAAMTLRRPMSQTYSTESD